LPGYGLYGRHAEDVVLRNVLLAAESGDERPAVVTEDVEGWRVL
jgi:hypothetical protein